MEGNTGSAKAIESNIHALSSAKAEARCDRSNKSARGGSGRSAEILRLEDFRPVPPPPAQQARRVEMEKLHSSITGMTRNLEAQSEACREFKGQIAELRAEIEDLGKNMDLYRTKLAGIDTNPIRHKALRLAQMMDPWTRP